MSRPSVPVPELPRRLSPTLSATVPPGAHSSRRGSLGRLPACAAAALLLTLAACEFPAGPEREPEAPEAPVARFQPVALETLPGWNDDEVAGALPAMARSCTRKNSLPADRPIGPGGIGGTAGEWRDACTALTALVPGDDAAARAFFATHFTALRVSNGAEPSADDAARGLFTGYYEAELNGSRRPGGRYATPLYRPPSDLVRADLGSFDPRWQGERLAGMVRDGRLVPYTARAEIDAGALAGKGLELLWVDDPVDAFFLHVQGSGRVALPGGDTVRVGYAADNGRPFYAIGRALIESGEMGQADMSMQGIRDWLRANPERAQELMHRNPRFIFFREIEGEGPIGALGVPLTPGRSMAVDPAHLPLGAPMWLDAVWPGEDRPLRRMMVAQDTGGAIKGVVRGDVFWGTGESALAVAGRMRSPGGYYLLLSNAVAARLLPAS